MKKARVSEMMYWEPDYEQMSFDYYESLDEYHFDGYWDGWHGKMSHHENHYGDYLNAYKSGYQYGQQERQSGHPFQYDWYLQCVELETVMLSDDERIVIYYAWGDSNPPYCAELEKLDTGVEWAQPPSWWVEKDGYGNSKHEALANLYDDHATFARDTDEIPF